MPTAGHTSEEEGKAVLFLSHWGQLLFFLFVLLFPTFSYSDYATNSPAVSVAFQGHEVLHSIIKGD